MTNQTSDEVIQLLCDLVYRWSDWLDKKEHYLTIHLPNLKKNPESGNVIENYYIRKLRSKATNDEWKRLEEIASDIDSIPRNYDYLSSILEQYLLKNDILAADNFIKRNWPYEWKYLKIPQLVQKSRELNLKEPYEKNILDQIHQACTVYDFELAEHLNTKLETAFGKHRSSILMISGRVKLKEEIRIACEVFDFTLATNLVEKLDDTDAKQNFWNLIEITKLKQKKEIRKRFIQIKKDEIEKCLRVYDFDGAASLFSEINGNYPLSEYSSLITFFRQKKEKEDFTNKLCLALSSGRFLEAETLFLESNLLTYEEYLDVKATAIAKYVDIKYSQQLNKEQAYALADISDNTLIKARAGSGKTRIIVTKVALLLDFFSQVELSDLIVLAFNKKAAQEINERMALFYRRPGFTCASTFHSLAYKIVSKELDILLDPSDKSKVVTQTQFVQNALRKVLQDDQQLANAYQFLRTEIVELEKNGLLLDEESHYLFRRGIPQITLRGERVYSDLEKTIADFLFECGVDYQYSKGFRIEKAYFRPSFFFTTNDQMLIIETWEHFNSRLDGEDRYSRHEIRQKLISMCEAESIRLLELTKEAITELSRLDIESILSNLLRENEVVLNKLPIEHLYRKVFENAIVITRLASLCSQFIKRAKKQSILPEDLELKLSTYTPIDERETAFLELIQLVYLKYEEEKGNAGKIDFDDLLRMAINKVKDSKGDCVVKVGKSTIHLNELQWIFIDEFQDFSDLFFQLVFEIRKYNGRVKLFCVGDDWQAINGFAGSDLKFFNNFYSLFGNTKSMELVTNHRSQAKIVQLGNKLMGGFGTGGEPLPENQTGYIKLFAIEDIQLFLGQDIQDTEFSSEKSFYLYKRDNGDKTCQISTSKYLRLVHAIVTSPKFIGKSVAILSRTDEIYGVSNSIFLNHLNKWLSSSDQEDIQNQTNFIEISTIHSYKGREADVVILLEVTDSKFPLIHPDNSLLNILGRTINDSLDEERRLFYVGITRAKSALFLLTEESRVSPFVKNDLELEFNDPNLHFPDLRVLKSNIPDYLENWDDEIPF